MKHVTTQDYVRFHIEASLDTLGLLSESERAELSLDVAASLTEMALGSLVETLPSTVSLRMLGAVSELRACSISERNYRESLEHRALAHQS